MTIARPLYPFNKHLFHRFQPREKITFWEKLAHQPLYAKETPLQEFLGERGIERDMFLGGRENLLIFSHRGL
jgi:hypothetical protein